MSDPSTSVVTWLTVDSWTRVCYPVRQACHLALTELGVEVEKPEGFRPEFPRSGFEREEVHSSGGGNPGGGASR